MGCWACSSVTSVLFLSFNIHALTLADFVPVSNLCQWCDYSSPVCEDNVCYSNCSFSSFCEYQKEICVAIWKQDNKSISVRTMCHDPQLPVENAMVPNYTTRECLMVQQPSEEGALYICGCMGEQECNDKLIFEKDDNGYAKLQSKEVIPVAVISLLPPILVAIMATMAFYLYRTRQQRKEAWPAKHAQRQTLEIPENRDPAEYDEKLSAMIDDSHSDISSTCANNINHNTELLPIELDRVVGKGRFADVWRARLNHNASGHYETVAVKIFSAEEYLSWKSERKIFSDANLKHESVLQFLTAEERGTGPQKQYWLITAYHSMGNLQEYLTNHVLSWSELHLMAGSLVSGVAHLHSDYTACGSPKIPISHRDIKSSNILVKSKTECVLCDFGLALRLDPSLTVEDFANSGQVGTARYMAPEVLESRVNLEELESFKQMDVYSMALVLWEMASRCDVIGEVKSYELPFGSQVCEHPCVESMRDLVLRERGRPDIPISWLVHQGMQFLCNTIGECWDHDPEARLTAHCVAERFSMMGQMENKDNLNNNNHNASTTGTEPWKPDSNAQETAPFQGFPSGVLVTEV
ncbi:TGF-beta receptor type-2 [Acipenser oxyrinchus oxyrinchus]|uniref:TGF-beta receptor type-2 n=1 Tax=Acipenser oxyrinchus oxyrinchus TaxID=40147 RepID=A0AAD8G2X8_ACIOX|nr:TGF-beta receptor type-2 [Acipenser oxyrinchus oxyrinchus]